MRYSFSITTPATISNCLELSPAKLTICVPHRSNQLCRNRANKKHEENGCHVHIFHEAGYIYLTDKYDNMIGL